MKKAEKTEKTVECKKCHRVFTDRINDRPMSMYVHQGEAVCGDCLIGMGVLPEHDAESHNTLLTEMMRYQARPW